MSYREHSKYTKSQIVNAWSHLVEDSTNEKDLAIVNEFRYSHEDITKEIKATIEKHPKVKFSWRRLKRTPSIIHKIRRSKEKGESMRLVAMQDIWGCRAVFDSMSDIYEFVEWIESNPSEMSWFKIKWINDYLYNKDCKYNYKFPQITKLKWPKKDWYRWVHIIFEYKWNDQYSGLLIELQLRTKKQHARATAVEIFDLMNEYKIKFWEWDNDSKKFFRRSSVVFEKDEWFKQSNYNKAKIKMKEIDNKTKILNSLWNRALSYSFTRWYEKEVRKKELQGDIILQINKDNNAIKVTPYHGKNIEDLKQLYLKLETEFINDDNVDIVYLSSTEIELAYPNYIWDASFFIRECKKYIN